jgi:RHS repeat-associated protein
MNESAWSWRCRGKSLFVRRDVWVDQFRARKSRRLVASLLALGIFVGLPASASAAECTNTWTGSAEGTWTTAANWSAGHVPTETEVACIGPGNTVKVTSGTNKVGVVQGEGGVVLSSTLEVMSTTDASDIGTLKLASSAILRGPATLKVSSSMTVTGEPKLQGAGSTVVKPGATATVEPSYYMRLEGRRLINEGTFTVDPKEGEIMVNEGAEILNKGTFNANSEQLVVIGVYGAGGTFVNEGTFQKTTGTGSSTVEIKFENKGTVDAQTGKLAFKSGGSSNASGQWKSSEGSEIRFIGGTHSMKESSLAGAVTVTSSSTLAAESVSGALSQMKVDSSGTLDIQGGSVTVGTLNLAQGGIVKGAGTLNVSSSLNWTAEGYMRGAGSTVILPGATATTSNNYYARIEKRRVVNEGTFTAKEGEIMVNEGAEFLNTGTFNANADALSTIGVYGAGGTFVNEGTFRKTAGTGTSTIEMKFENKGIVDVQTGKLNVKGGGSTNSLAQWTTAEGSELRFTAGTFSLNGGSMTGAVTVAGAAVTAEGVSGSLSQVTVESGSMTDVSNSMTVEGLVLKSLGTMNVLGSPKTVKNLVIGGGAVLKGAGTLKASSSMTVTGEPKFQGAGSTVVMPSASATVNTSYYMRIEGRRLVNEGTFTVNPEFGEVLVNEDAEIINTGTFNANSEKLIALGVYGAGGTFVNRGTYQKTAGTETSQNDLDFENYGVVRELTGKLKITHPIAVISKEQFGKRCHMGDPVECATGNLSESQTDLAVGGRGVGLVLTRTYSAQAAVAATGPGAFGYGWSGSFGDSLSIAESGAKVTVVLGDGSTIPFTRVSGSTYSGPAWSQAVLQGSSEGGYALTGSNQIEMSFSGTGRLQDITDRNGNETTLAYDESGRLTTVTDPAGRTLTLTYNVGGQVATAEDPLGHLVKYTYESGKLASVTRPGSEALRWQFKYDGSRRLTSMTDARGGKTTSEYDSSSRVISQTDPASRTLSFKYEPFHTTITNKATGMVTDQWFTSSNQPFSITHGLGTPAATTETFAYDDAGRIIRATDGIGHSTHYEYNAAGDLVSELDAGGNERKWAYNGTHDVTSITEPGGETTTIVRDANGNPESISRPGPEGTTQSYEMAYGGNGELEELTDPLERVWTYGYNEQGDLTSEADPEGNTLSIAYDEGSRPIALVAPRGNVEGAEPVEFETTIERDAFGWPLKVTNPLGDVTEYSYDASGNMATATDARGNTTKFTYDAVDQLTKVELPNGALRKTGYDGAGMVTSRTDGNGETTTYVRDAVGNPVEVIDPLGRKTVQEYDAAGNLEAIFDAAERTTTFAYDDTDRLVGVDYSEAATADASYEYDADGNLTKMVDGTGESTFVYDVLGRLTEVENGNGATVGYGYDLADELTQITYPNGKSISRTFDDSARLESVTDWLGGTTSFAYDADSNLESIAFPNATENIDEYAYDRAGLVSQASFEAGPEILTSLSYSRDQVGQIEDEAQVGLPGPAELGYGYDKNGRLISAGEASFEYDLADNLTSGLGSTNSYDAASQLEAGTGVSYSFDQLGQRTESDPESGPATTYGYDQAGLLVAVDRPSEGETPAIDQSLAYDGAGLLASKTSGATTSQLTWDVGSTLPLLLDDAENSYVYGPEGLAIEQISTEESPSYLHQDQLGSTRAITDAGGEVTGTFSYGPFGSPSGATGSATTPLGFAGEYTDAETGLQYLRARFYDPATGQFLTHDPAEELTRQPYAYASDDPVNSVDPSGEIAAAAACAATIEIPIVGEVTCGAAVVTGAAAAGALAGSLLFPEETDEGEYVNPTYAAPTYVNPLTRGITQARGKGSDDLGCGPSGKRLRKEGEEILGRGHTDAARERWQEWIKGKTKRERKEYDRAGGPRPGKKNRR